LADPSDQARQLPSYDTICPHNHCSGKSHRLVILLVINRLEISRISRRDRIRSERCGVFYIGRNGYPGW